MKEKFKYTVYRKVLFCTGVCMLAELVTPTAAWALTSGPAQPEFSSFEPVATTNMVNEFTGDFTYNLPLLNIPGANGGGYAMSLSYHSGASPEEEASWVGYGWTLNPGSINRGKKGFPDDFKGKEVKYWNKTPVNWTSSLGGSLALEAFSRDLKNLLGGSVNASLRYNSYKGFGSSAGANLSIAKGLVSLGYHVSDGEGSFSAQVNPMAVLALADKEKKKDDYSVRSKEIKGRLKANKKKLEFNKRALSGGIGVVNLIGSNYGAYSHSTTERPTTIPQYKGASYNVSFGFIPTGTPLELGPNVMISGNYTRQENVNASGESGKADPVSAFGYMYAAEAGSVTAQMDYYTEKDNPFDKRDYYLGMPFSNADNYMVTGEGIGGGFRLYNKTAGHYRPRQVESNMSIFNVGAEAEAGFNVGGGAKLGVGFQRFSSIGWNNSGGFSKYEDLSEASLTDEPYYFRFNNDKGGFHDFNGDDALAAARIKRVSSKAYDADVSGITATSNYNGRSGRSSYIAYHTNDEMKLEIDDVPYKSYTLNEDINTNLVNRDNASIADGIGELAVFNEDGTRYVYGLPVYSRKEKNLSYDLQGVPASKIDNNYIAYRDISNDNALKSKVGEETDAAYASTYLLTEITAADYVDRTMNGASDDDFGGYTRFAYKRLYGHSEKDNASPWYRWRIPYTGLTYNKGELSTSRDDMGAVICGEKEIYYLDSIITKTHYAVFHTSNREDGFDAADNNTAANSSTAKGNNSLKRLDAIKLYAKNPGGTAKLVQTVRFEYYEHESNDELCKGLPNGSSGNTGKLTLKRVWFEYEGTYTAKISPYTFEYKYPGEGVYPEKYAELDNQGTGKNENPAYSAHNIDAWGNYQEFGDQRFDSLKTWVNQVPLEGFDPAAWQLKVIKLPTGGEIHIQYEQDDYRYVQDKAAEAMVSFTEIDGNDYYLNTEDLGTPDLVALRDSINRQYAGGKKKMYFKFLYALIGFNPSINSCASEYISGYCNVKNARIDDGKLIVELLAKPGKAFDLPDKVCRDFVKKERIGQLSLSGNCDASETGIKENNDPKQAVQSLLAFLGTKMIPGNQELCMRKKPSLSYFRIPIAQAKKGGGVRVKCLLMFDKGMEAESDDRSLFGTEYHYIDQNGMSSGVATNEPGAIREENALVEFDPRLRQKFIDKVISGRDRDKTEKPLGESVLPSPSVGYSRVLISNIHSGKTNTGFVVKEFYTAKDFPVKVEYTEMDREKEYRYIPGGLVNFFVNNIWLAQGFTVKLNEMHGQVKREATYGGSHTDIGQARLSSETVYEYFAPGENIPIMNDPGNISYQALGKETELVFENRGMEDVSHDMGVEFDASVGFAIIPVPQFSIVPSYTYSESKIFSHVTNKIIQYPAIQKKIRTNAEGIYHETEHIAFNPHSGKPVMTKNTDGFDGLNLEQSAGHKGYYTSVSMPASQQYKGMGQKAGNERLILKSDLVDNTLLIKKNTTGGKYYLEFISPSYSYYCGLVNRFCPGDIIKLTTASGLADAGIFSVTDSIVQNRIFILPTNHLETASDSLHLNTSLIVEVLRSGCTNQLNANVGNFTTYGESNVSSSSNLAAASFVNYLNQKLPYGEIKATDPFFKNNPDLKLEGAAWTGCLPFTKPDGSFDSTETIFTNSTGKIIVQATPINLAIAIYRKSGSISAACLEGCDIDEDNPTYHYFKINLATGSLQASLNEYCYECKQDFDCIKFCPGPYSGKTSNVLAASAQTFDHNWPYDNTIYAAVPGTNDYEKGAKGKWRTLSDYVYRDSVTGANAGSQRIYKNAGVFEMEPFNWTDTSANGNKWVKVNTVKKYSPDGNALEEQDILGIYSTAKFGYDKTQPYLIAKNSEYGTVQFESFEKAYASELEDGLQPGDIGVSRTSSTAHSGLYSWKLTAGFNEISLKSFQANAQVLSKGMLLKVWVKDPSFVKAVPVTGAFNGFSGTLNFTFKNVARTGEWSLYEAKLTGAAIDAVFNLGETIHPAITNDYTATDIWIDDIRMQPLDAQMTAYVYDVETLRPLAIFDDQHFGLYYQYNGQGKLVRKLIETERGIKTITETQYHTVETQRSN